MAVKIHARPAKRHRQPRLQPYCFGRSGIGKNGRAGGEGDTADMRQPITL